MPEILRGFNLFGSGFELLVLPRACRCFDVVGDAVLMRL
jgi:hypothetical protein